MAMTKAEKEKMEALAIGAESVAKANKILTSAIKKVIKDKTVNVGSNALVDSTVVCLKKALEKVKGGVVVKKKVVK